jgi:hypothetical protein
LVDQFPFGGPKPPPNPNPWCHEGSTSSMHTWNYNQNTYAGGNLYSVCATVSSGYYAEVSDGINGSGCANATNHYSLCHNPVANLYYAWIAQWNNGASHTLAGYAETGRSCSSPSARASRTRAPSAVRRLASKVAVFRSQSHSPTPARVFGILAAAADLAPAADEGAAIAPDLSQVRRVGPDASTSDGTVFVAPTATGACQVLELDDGSATASACAVGNDSDTISAPRVTRTESGYTVWGTMVDGVKFVHVATSIGGVDAAVERNGYAVTVTSLPTGFTWSDSSGATHAVDLTKLA